MRLRPVPLLLAAALALGSAAALPATSPALAQSAAIDPEAILHDPAAPVGGNPKGDVTIVAYLDYNCPFCKRSAPDLDRVVAADGHIRLVYKDWPILAPSSVTGARLALAAGYQGRYEAAHDALMAISGKRASDEAMRDAIAGAGIDMARLDADLRAHRPEIDALLKRNLAQADALGLEGTPVFLIGPYKVAAALDADGFRKAVADARARAGQPAAR